MPPREQPTQEQINEVKSRFLARLAAEPPTVPFHPNDLARINDNDNWIARLLTSRRLNVERSIKSLWNICVWRQSYGVYDVTEASLNQEIFQQGHIYMHNRDNDGMPLLIIAARLHTKAQSIDDLIRIIVYWVERWHRESNLERMTIFMDMTDAGLSNLDLDFVKRVIQLFEQYYPNVPNYIIVHELPFLLNAAFKIVKGFLPAEALEILRVTTKKDINEYVNKDNCLTSWGGNDDYVYTVS